MEFTFTNELWEWTGKSAWHFITLPIDIAQIIKEFVQSETSLRQGFGSLKVSVTIGETNWETSIFPDNSRHSYLLPIKKSVRQKEKLLCGESVKVNLQVLLP